MSSDDSRRRIAPAALGVEYEGQQAGDAAFVPSRRVRRGDAEATLELRRTEDGQLAMLAYSSLELLVDGCGEGQPWVAVPRERVAGLLSLSEADVVLWDVALSPELRHPTDEETY